MIEMLNDVNENKSVNTRVCLADILSPSEVKRMVILF